MTTTRTIDLQKFCSEDETRVPLMKPWREGEFTYASDGRVVLRVPAELKDAVNTAAPTAAQLDKYFGIFGNGAGGLLWRKLPTLPEVKFGECETCHGDKSHACDCGHQHECPNCEGTGQIPDDGHLDIGPARFSCYYLRLIADLPNLEIAIRGELDPMMLRFDGGVGVLMGMKH